jgi:nitrite reductase (NADH) small subunit
MSTAAPLPPSATPPAMPAIGTWHTVCPVSDIVPNTGVAALIGRRQIAVVRTVDRTGAENFYGISNWCPFSKAMVISRGIVGSKGDIPKIASPIYKQSFDLRSGACLDDPTVRIPTFPVRIADGFVQISA